MGWLMLGDTTPRQIGVNVETVLDDRDVYHAIGAVITNVIDEQALTGTPDIVIRAAARRARDPCMRGGGRRQRGRRLSIPGRPAARLRKARSVGSV